jgi:hypothetical protein
MTDYTLTVLNESTGYENFAVYQNDPDLGVQNAMSLAWFVKGAHPSTVAWFEWSLDYSFMWCESGSLSKGVVFKASEEWSCDPSNIHNNAVALDFQQNAFLFKDSPISITPRIGNLYVSNLSTVPVDIASVALAVGGKAAYATPAEPNRLDVWTPHPNYWITAGTYQPGVALDAEEISSTAAQITYAPGVFNMTAVYTYDRNWKIYPTPPTS